MTTIVLQPLDKPKIQQLLALAMRGLEPMFDAQQGLFCHRLCQSGSQLTREGISQRYTIMTLLGLLRAESIGLQSPVNVNATLDRLLTDSGWINNLGDLGLLLWLCSHARARHLQRFLTRFDLSNALERYSDAQRQSTMELSWFLTGLAYAERARGRQAQNFAPLATATYQLLTANQGPYGLFGHMGRRRSLAGWVRGHVGSFADQVYPIYAFSCFARTYGNGDALKRASHCADAICKHQGPLGQWWWHYDSVTGTVAEKFPVYSVHQHAMAPMALLALQNASGRDFTSPIARGLRWIDRENELREDLVDPAASLVWRCIRPSGWSTYKGRISRFLIHNQRLDELEILHECRPYELGWMLYAFADDRSHTQRPQIELQLK